MALSPDMKVRIKVVDVETTSLEGDPDWTHASNRVVLFGVYDPDWNPTLGVGVTHEALEAQRWLGLQVEGANLLVGHNLMFDIPYLVKEGVVNQRTLARHATIWDTMVAEYILTGQRDRFITLEAACATRGIAFAKSAIIRAHFESGKGADTVERSELEAYLKEDVSATYKLFLAQYEAAETQGMLPLIQAMMNFRLATIDMRMNGIHLDPDALKSTKEVCVNQMEAEIKQIPVHHGVLQQASEVFYPKELRAAQLDPMKGPQLSKLLYGGTYKQTIAENVGTYKNGKPKFKNKIIYVPIVGLLRPLGFLVAKDHTSVDEEALEDVCSKLGTITARIPPHSSGFAAILSAMLKSVLAFRKAVKIISTYVAPSQLDAMRYGNKMYPTIHVTLTLTGRTSCSCPNLQNVPKKSLGNYRRAIVSPKGRMLVEFDYKQLEVVALAVLTGDRQLISDLILGVDMHTTLFEQVHGRLPSEDERRDFKCAVFCLIYGGGVGAIARQGKTTLAKALILQHKFHERYPDVMIYREGVLKDVDRMSWVSPVNKYGIPHRMGRFISKTNRHYIFEQKLYKNTVNYKTWKKENVCDWSKQELANYPIQGFATADIAPLMIGVLYRYVYSEAFPQEHAPMLRIPVHDSVLVDVDEGTLARDVGLMARLLETVPEQLAKVFGLDSLGLPFKVGVSVGRNWEDMNDYK